MSTSQMLTSFEISKIPILNIVKDVLAKKIYNIVLADNSEQSCITNKRNRKEFKAIDVSDVNLES